MQSISRSVLGSPSFPRLQTGLSDRQMVAEECLFGKNWAKIDVRTFARIKKVIWDQLLAAKAEIIQS